MKKILIVTLICAALIAYIEFFVEPITIESTTTTEATVSSLACVKIGDTELERLRVSGVALDYHDNTWFFNDTPVAKSRFEDEDFVACENPIFMQRITDIALGE